MWQYNYTSNELYHYGILGMKWGKRKAKGPQSDADYRQSKIDKATARIDKKLARKQAKIDKKNAKIEKAGGKKKYIAKKVARGSVAVASLLGSAYGLAKASSLVLNDGDSWKDMAKSASTLFDNF